jgi:hypothetical protein
MDHYDRNFCKEAEEGGVVDPTEADTDVISDTPAREEENQGDRLDSYDSYDDHLPPPGQGFNFLDVSLSPVSSSAGDLSDREDDHDNDYYHRIEREIQLMSESPHSILCASERWPTPSTPMAPKKSGRRKPISEAQQGERAFVSSSCSSDSDNDHASVRRDKAPAVKRRKLSFSAADLEDGNACDVQSVPPEAEAGASQCAAQDLSLPSPGIASASLPPFASTVHWNRLLKEHESLLESKGKINGRKFNKTALDLLNACVQLVKNGLDVNATAEGWYPGICGPANQKKPLKPPGDHEEKERANEEPSGDPEDMQALSKFRKLLLNKKEVAIEQLVEKIVLYVVSRLPPHLTVDEKKEAILRKCLALVVQLSPAVSLKAAPVIRSYVSQMFDSELENLFAEIRMPEMSPRQKALLYRKMFSNFIDDDSCVSFATSNKALLGRVHPRDVYFLTFFAFITTRRVRGDNLLQLGCVGT